MGPELLIPLLAPVVTELVKWLLGKVVNDVPPWLVPLLSAVAGGAMGAVPQMHSSLAEGLELGLAGTGVHQLTRRLGVSRRTVHTRASDKRV